MLMNSNDCVANLNNATPSCGSRSGPRWFVAITHPRQEKRAKEQIENQDFPVYLPMWLTGPLFPRYLFVAFDPDKDPWGAIINTRGIMALIRHAPSRPTPVPDGVVEYLESRTSSRGIVDDPGEAKARILPVGTAVSVLGGGLAGLQGIVTKSAAERCAVLIRLMGREITASVDMANLVAA